MDFDNIDSNDPDIVSEDAFWHSNMDLYYGYQPGEVVEVEHESNKYWLATIEYTFKHLILLKWVGNYGEFWVDTFVQNSTSGSSSFGNEFSPKRIFFLGYHLQSQLKSQFILERPTKVLIQPTLYNPANDPYAEIKTVEDLLSQDIDRTKDAFGNESSGADINEATSLGMAKCKTKIAYGQEDVDELEAALQNLNQIDAISSENKSPDIFNNPSVPNNTDNPCKNILEENAKVENLVGKEENMTEIVGSGETSDFARKSSGIQIRVGDENKTVLQGQIAVPQSFDDPKTEIAKDTSNKARRKKPKVDHELYLRLCKTLQESAMTKGRYIGINDHSDKVFYLKPKQLFDIGGANHERVFMPGTLLEICHTIEKDGILELCHWFAVVLKNCGGRLTLQWLLCDEPKFKQGRLELKSSRSDFIKEEQSDDSNDVKDDLTANPPTNDGKIPVKGIIFCLHFCNPRVHSISHAKLTDRPYKMPEPIIYHLNKINKSEDIPSIEQAHVDHIFDYRRMNLDKDRPIIDHLLSTCRWMMPKYINLSFAPLDKNSKREILLSTPKTTKLLRGFVKREIEAGVYEINSEPLSENGKVIKFIYPYDSSYTILPTNWAIDNPDCLSIHPSRRSTPVPGEKSSGDFNQSSKAEDVLTEEQNINIDKAETPVKNQEYQKLACMTQQPVISYQPARVNIYTLLCEIPKATKLSNQQSINGNDAKDQDFDELEPKCWSEMLRYQELNAPEFSCSINYDSQTSVQSKFKIMDQLEVVHFSSDNIICLGRVRKVVYPLLWIQLSKESFTLLPFNSTDIYPIGWCDNNNYSLISLLPPRKILNHQVTLSSSEKKRKRAKRDNSDEIDQENIDEKFIYEKEQLDLNALSDKQLDLDYLINEKSLYIRIYFNHKCFTGPSLSKGKICSLPQYVGPGPLRLVMDEVVTKIISVAYVPPRILNDLSSKSFKDLLVARNLSNTAPMEFKAKYQKRVHREYIPVCLNPDDLASYCECVCEHLKCCYNLFGPSLYDGDDCPGHCRALTKSNKFMKRATYYREKARLGEFTNDSNAKKSNNNTTSNNNTSSTTNKTSKSGLTGQASSESTSPSVSKSDQLNSRASSACDENPLSELKENLVALGEMENHEDEKIAEHETEPLNNHGESQISMETNIIDNSVRVMDPEMDKNLLAHSTGQDCNFSNHNNAPAQSKRKWPEDYDEFKSTDLKPEDWTCDDVADQLESSRLSKFKSLMMSEGIDGQALLLLDKVAIREHFQQQTKLNYTSEELGKLARFVDFVKAHANSLTRIES